MNHKALYFSGWLLTVAAGFGMSYVPALGIVGSRAGKAPLVAEIGRVVRVVDGDTYGPLKVACEDDVSARHADAATIVRPGIVAGPYDPTERFTHWVRRAGRGGRVALPGRPDQPVQVVDSRDLAHLVVQLVHDDRPGTYNAGTAVEVVPVPQSAVQPDLPLVLGDASFDPLARRSAARARAVGLTATPLEKTAADVLAWDRLRGEPPLASELSAEREADLLR